MKKRDLRLLLSISGSRTLLVVSIFASLMWAALVLGNAFLIASIIVGVIGKNPETSIQIFELLVVWVVRIIFQTQFERWTSHKAVEIKAELRKKSLHSGGLNDMSPTEFSNLMIKGLNSLDTYIGRFIPQMIFASTTPAIVITTLFLLDPISSLIALVTLPLIPIFGILIGKYTSSSVMAKWRELGTLAKYFEDSMRGFVTLKIFGRHRSQSQRIYEMGARYTEETLKVLRISFLSSLVLELCATISVALIAVSIGVRLVDGAIGFAPSLTILILAPEVYFPLRNAAALFHSSADGAEAVNQINSIARREDSQRDFKSFSWENWKNHQLNIEIPAHSIEKGKCTSLIGESGIGKSTFISFLLSRLETNKVTWIPQNPKFLRGSIRHQFVAVNSSISDDEIIALLAKVNLTIDSLPLGLDTEIGGVGEKNHRVSGGQLRKIAISRALSKRAQYLIADEPFADLDASSIQAVLEQFNEFKASGGAILLVAHQEIASQISDFSVEVAHYVS